MKMLIDFLPIAVFFIVYQMTKDIVLATAVLIPATIAQVLFTWWRYRKIEKMHLVTLALVVVLGGATVLFHNGDFIKWKPTIVNWLFGVAFLLSPLFGGKTLIQRMMEKNLTLPKQVWTRLNLAWVAFFLVLGAVNIFVFKSFSEETWVDFKLFGMMGLTLLFILMQGVYLARHMKNNPDSINAPNRKE
ncbi:MULTISPECIES: septation protein A [Larsenimonas]|uniref:Inner membrane-spanning protein YciB n=1 Tax=Larsenimonas suaedae TaxID=1851019 RepID=A0ABU1GU10_9GAMM|nr:MULTISPECIES: septation protein A [Larsenimonas]MCM2971963.1 septation protein A [Larsenimonas suaedae]MCM5705347.1 septation protein A [Larsenimonas salina]MDR5895515.1 septation protein A [Larsenimonas suaedae]